jgi:mono/diheme cytochrome c family protein
MKQHFREIVGFLVIALSLFGFVSAFAADAVTDPNQKLFEGKCAQCHDKDAKGNVKMAKILKVDPIKVDLTRAEAVSLTSDQTEAIVSKGQNKMPKFSAKLTADQIKSIVTYLKTLQAAAAAK